ncbi:MAG: hypothetical protein LBE18_04345, partial [Planctomycetaceae bacterium]|nr:hypothetical protein [Planctomycetaceae bacterium]
MELNRQKYNPNIHHRRSIRLKEYDYSQAGLYFITICTPNRECIFGEIRRGEGNHNLGGDNHNLGGCNHNLGGDNIIWDGGNPKRGGGPPPPDGGLGLIDVGQIGEKVWGELETGVP